MASGVAYDSSDFAYLQQLMPSADRRLPPYFLPAVALVRGLASLVPLLC